jgi:murein DD-endopeptidase MepM/ murein hydrolase activator NlpD
MTTYGGLGSIAVRPGERVYVGDTLGTVAGTGRIAHIVHLELDRDNYDGSFTAMNPLRYLDLAGAIVPPSDANRFNRGPSEPAKQPDFSWDLRRYLPI